MDEALGRDLDREIGALVQRRAFGLNFERHVPEIVELPGAAIRKGSKVRILPERGHRTVPAGAGAVWRVTEIKREVGGAAARLESVLGNATATIDTADLVVVAEFRDPIYPGLVSTGSVTRGGDRPFHTVINAENYHALQTLLFTHRGRVDCIYIDPPYNTGARDWKYNNDYVESDDLYRHSKWLAFMERRLMLARDLLRADNSMLIVTIDEKEYLRLGLLLEQCFPEAKIQMITSVIKPGGTSRTKEFSRVEEYVFFVFLGNAEIVRTTDNMLAPAGRSEDDAPAGIAESDLWEGMIRRGIGVVRSQREGQFYPIFIHEDRGAIVHIGEPPGAGVSRDSVPDLPGLTTVWPIKDDLTEGFWQLSPEGLAKARERGTVRVGSYNSRTAQWRIQYMKAKKAKAVMDGTVATLGKDENGVVILDLERSTLSSLSTPRTVWNKTTHDASTGGAGLLNRMLPDRKFPFAKSLYAVEDALRFFVSDKPDAVVLDFFAGSGTTAHAVMRLNEQDNGRRSAILVTNNEVGAGEQAALRGRGLRPGDVEWEERGICELVTKPRIRAAVTGLTPAGDPIVGEYKGDDPFPIADGLHANVEFFSLTYESPFRVATDRAFERIAPLLWLRAGGRGRRIEGLESGWDVTDAYGVIADLDAVDGFLHAVKGVESVAMAFIVTDEDRLFEAVVRELPERVEPVRLYEAYLRNFEVETGRSTL
jgi:adenine-specific DNA-methyltransferase